MAIYLLPAADSEKEGTFTVFTEPADTSKPVARWTHGEWWSTALRGMFRFWPMGSDA